MAAGGLFGPLSALLRPSACHAGSRRSNSLTPSRDTLSRSKTSSHSGSRSKRASVWPSCPEVSPRGSPMWWRFLHGGSESGAANASPRATSGWSFIARSSACLVECPTSFSTESGETSAPRHFEESAGRPAAYPTRGDDTEGCAHSSQKPTQRHLPVARCSNWSDHRTSCSNSRPETASFSLRDSVERLVGHSTTSTERLMGPSREHLTVPRCREAGHRGSRGRGGRPSKGRESSWR